MLLHMDLILQVTVSSVTLQTIDIDVLDLAVAASNRHTDKQIWVNYGVGEHKKIFAAHKIQIAIGTEKAAALLVFQGFTGCDTVSSFKTNEKNTAWERWKSFSDATEAFLTLSRGPGDIDKETRCLLERFVILLYDKTSPQTSINVLHKELFTRGCSIEKIPLTSGALLQHDRRTTYQGGHCWVKMTKNANVASIYRFVGIVQNSINENYVPSVSKYSGSCGCRRSKQHCTDLCKCKGLCKW